LLDRKSFPDRNQNRQHFGDGSLSPVELLDATVERAKSVQSRLNPFRVINAEQARKTARASERRWAEGNPLSPLDGVPVAIKDNQAIAGEPHTSGSRALEHLPPATADAPHVARLRDAGALFYARTTMPDLAWKAVNDSPLSGVTRNPWNPALTPGGSSGGSAVAVATGCGPIATGSDGRGSIRIPAAFTGISVSSLLPAACLALGKVQTSPVGALVTGYERSRCTPCEVIVDASSGNHASESDVRDWSIGGK
jgi:Asp-tRNA(Asn)/Glu-tRNA(Gln) amidotransferase A subunit family amidase